MEGNLRQLGLADAFEIDLRHLEMASDKLPDGPLRSAIQHLFNDDFEASRALLREYAIAAPNDPLGYSVSAAILFYHFVASRLESQHENSIRKMILGHGIGLTSELKLELGTSLQRGEALALADLAANAQDQNATFALCVAEGVNRDLMALVYKRWMQSFRHAQAATLRARQLLSLNHKAYDAYFVIGFSEYLIQEIPAIFRPFTKIPGIVGQTSRAIQFLDAAASGGDYFREFARQMLVTVYTENGRELDALQVLAGLTRDFPNNRSYQAEWTKRKTNG